MSDLNERDQVVSWLRHIRAIKEQMQSSIDIVTEHIASMDSLRSIIASDMPHSPNTNIDAIPDMVIRLMELLEEAQQTQQDGIAEVEEAYRLCHRTPEATMLWMHEVDKMTWREVGKAMGYSMEHALRKTSDCIKMLYDLMPANFRSTSNNVNV